VSWTYAGWYVWSLATSPVGTAFLFGVTAAILVPAWVRAVVGAVRSGRRAPMAVPDRVELSHQHFAQLVHSRLVGLTSAPNLRPVLISLPAVSHSEMIGMVEYAQHEAAAAGWTPQQATADQATAAAAAKRYPTHAEAFEEALARVMRDE
jgi:hypothetical protein